MAISEETKMFLFREYRDAYEDLHDSHYWEEEHERASRMCFHYGEIINALGLKEEYDKYERGL